jgi:hypothetical protein
VRDALQARDFSRRKNVLALLRNWNQNRGTQVMPTRSGPSAAPGLDLEPDESTLPDLAPGEWCDNRLMSEYARRFLALAAARDIPVFLVIPPLGREAQGEQDRAGFSRFYTRFARRLLQTHPNLIVVDARRSRYPESAFHDRTHLNASGALSLSGDLGAVIARHLDSPSVTPRWHVLPPYRDRPVEIPLENLGQSAVALKGGAKGRY